MPKLEAKIVHDMKILAISQPAADCVDYPEDEGSSLLKRRAPILHKPYWPQPGMNARQGDGETE
jgi:hypothetical protein